MRKARSFLKKVLPVSFATGLLAGVALTSVAVAISGSAIFQDVPAGSYYSDAVGRMYSIGIIKGKDDTHFDPAGTLTRADAAVLMDRLYTKLNGSPAESGSSSSRSRSSSSSSSSSVSSSSSSSSSQATVGDAGAIHFAQREFNIDKNDATGQVNIVIARLGKNSGPVTVDYSFSGGTAVAGKDYDPISGTLSFATHESSKKLTVKIRNNTSVSGTKTVNLVLSKPTGGVVLDSPSTSVLNINDPNVSSSSGNSSSNSSVAITGPQFAFSASEYTVYENKGSQTVTVVRSGITSTAADVSYSTSNDTATSGADYNSTSGTLNFAANETSKTFVVTISNNGNIDGARRLNLTLSNPTAGATIITPATAKMIINDDESMTATGSGSFKFSSGTFAATESSGVAYINIMRIGNVTPASVNFNTNGGSALSGTDYTVTSTTVNFAAGETVKTVAVPIVADSISDGGETVILQLSSPTNGVTLTDPSNATLTINE